MLKSHIRIPKEAMMLIKILLIFTFLSPLYSVETDEVSKKEREKLFTAGSLFLTLGVLNTATYSLREEIRNANLKNSNGGFITLNYLAFEQMRQNPKIEMFAAGSYYLSRNAYDYKKYKERIANSRNLDLLSIAFLFSVSVYNYYGYYNFSEKSDYSFINNLTLSLGKDESFLTFRMTF